MVKGSASGLRTRVLVRVIIPRDLGTSYPGTGLAVTGSDADRNGYHDDE